LNVGDIIRGVNTAELIGARAKVMTATELIDMLEDLSTDDIIVCSTEARTRAVAAAALRMEQPYVPFRAMFVEGTLLYSGEGSDGVDPTYVDMVPA
jgi:hypothetical protein